MRFHGITMEGEYKAQSVVDVSALVWESDDERRIVYDETTNSLWVATGPINSDWKSIGNYGDIEQGTQMWFYAASQPDGWTINGTPSDVLLAVRPTPTSGIYNTGGTEKGNWTTPSHSHDMAHAHGVSAVISLASGYPGKNQGDDSNKNSIQAHVHGLSIAAIDQSPSTLTSFDGWATGYRPLSRVGIICSKN